MDADLIPIQTRTNEIQRLYKKYISDYRLRNMPDLYINWKSQCDSLSVIADEHIHLLAELQIKEIDWCLHSRDIEAVLYHEFTHILDAVLLNKVGKKMDTHRVALSEIHASQIEMMKRLSVGELTSPWSKISIPYYNKDIPLAEYLDDNRTDIIAFLDYLPSSRIENAAKAWKHTQYYAAKISCCEKRFNVIPSDKMLDGVPPALISPFLSVSRLVLENPSLVVSPPQVVLEQIDSAFSYLRDHFSISD